VIDKLAVRIVDKQVISFMPALRVGQDLSTRFFFVKFVQASPFRRLVFPLVGIANFRSKTTVCTHDRAPELASQVLITGMFGGRGVVTTARINIEVPVVCEIHELPAP